MANTTWNPSDLALTTLSGGNLTATSTGTTGYVRSINNKLAGAGKFYWEIQTATINGTNTGMGFCPIALSSPSGATAAGMCVCYRSGNIYVAGANTGSTIGVFSNTQTLSIALDLVAKLVWFRRAPSGAWNATSGSTNNPATGVGGISVSSVLSSDACPLVTWGATSDVMVANFGGSGFVGAVPSGFTAGWPPPPIELAGNLGGVSSYGNLKYGLKKYSRVSAFASVFSADLDVHVSLVDLAGGIAPQIALGGPLTVLSGDWALSGSLLLSVVLGPSEFVSGPLWAAETPVTPSWAPSGPCPPPSWMTTAPCAPVEWKKSELCNG